MKLFIKKALPWPTKALLVWLMYANLPAICHAQAPELGLWIGVNAEKMVSRSIGLHLNGHLRYGDNLRVRRSALAEVGLSYRISRRWEVTGYYRYSSRRQWDDESYQYTYRPFHRFYAHVSHDRKLGKLKLDYRLRYQNQFKDDAGSQETGKSYLRNKLELSYPNPSRFTPYVSTDLFYKLGEGIDQLRNKVGVSVGVARHQRMDVFGFTDYQFIERQKNQLILGVSYKVKF